MPFTLHQGMLLLGFRLIDHPHVIFAGASAASFLLP